MQLPTNTQTQGPQQAQSAMTSDPRVASELALLRQSNKVIFGNLLTLPIADGGILYVEPLYTQRNSANAFPQLARVMVSFTDTTGIRSATRRRSRRRWTRCSGRARAARHQAEW